MSGNAGHVSVLHYFVCTSRVRGMSRMLFTPAHTTVMGVRASSVRSADTSMLLSPPLCTPPMPVQQDGARLSSRCAQLTASAWFSVPACCLRMAPSISAGAHRQLRRWECPPGGQAAWWRTQLWRHPVAVQSPLANPCGMSSVPAVVSRTAGAIRCCEANAARRGAVQADGRGLHDTVKQARTC